MKASEVLKLYQKYTGEQGSSVFALPNGLSNKSFLIDGRFVLRVKQKSDPLFYSSKSEERILKAIENKEIAPKILAFDSKNGNLISEYASTCLPLQTECPDEPSLKALAKTLRLLHSLKLGRPTLKDCFLPLERYESYRRSAGESLNPKEEKALAGRVAEIISEEGAESICHNDLWGANILIKNDKALLIDFEFAGLNNPLFDLASVIGENKIVDEGKIEFFLKSYYGSEYNEKSKHEVLLFTAFSNYLWYYWAKQRYQDTKENGFLAIASDKAKAISFANLHYLNYLKY